MEFQQLKGFYYSAKYGSLTKAAEKMSVTQSAISQQIKSLEEELDIKLFNRYGPRKELTPDGKTFLSLISPLIDEIDSLKRTFEDMKGNQKGILTIAATTFIIMNFLPLIIKKFTTTYPDVKFVILERRWTEIVNLAQAGEIDFGIAPMANIPPTNLEYIELVPFERVLITSRNHPLAKKKNITLLDIAQYPMITYEEGLVSREEFDKIFKQIQLDIDVVMEVTNAETIKKYVEIGVGIAIIPEIALHPASHEILSATTVSKYFGKSHYGVILRKGRHITRWAQNFLALITPSWVEKDQSDSS